MRKAMNGRGRVLLSGVAPTERCYGCYVGREIASVDGGTLLAVRACTRTKEPDKRSRTVLSLAAEADNSFLPFSHEGSLDAPQLQVLGSGVKKTEVVCHYKKLGITGQCNNHYFFNKLQQS